MKLHLFFPNSICALVLKKDYTGVLEITHREYNDYFILKVYCQMLISFHGLIPPLLLPWEPRLWKIIYSDSWQLASLVQKQTKSPHTHTSCQKDNSFFFWYISAIIPLSKPNKSYWPKEVCPGQRWDTAAIHLAMLGPICKSWMLSDTGQSEAYLKKPEKAEQTDGKAI